MKVEDLKPFYAQNVGTAGTYLPSKAVPTNMQGGIFWLKVVNKHAGAQDLEIVQEGVGTATVDVITFSAQNETQDFLLSGADKLVPLYKFRGGQKVKWVPSAGTVHIYMLWAEGEVLE